MTAQGLGQPKHMVNVSRWNEGGGGGRIFLGNECLVKSGFLRVDGERPAQTLLENINGESRNNGNQ